MCLQTWGLVTMSFTFSGQSTQAWYQNNKSAWKNTLKTDTMSHINKKTFRPPFCLKRQQFGRVTFIQITHVTWACITEQSWGHFSDILCLNKDSIMEYHVLLNQWCIIFHTLSLLLSISIWLKIHFTYLFIVMHWDLWFWQLGLEQGPQVIEMVTKL